jgi:subtilisin family serine protease
MTHREIAMPRALVLLLLTLPFAAGAAELLKVREPVADRFIVVLDPGRVAGDAAVDALARQLAGLAGGRVLHTYSGIVGGFALQAPRAALGPLLAHAAVSYVEPDSVMRKAETQRAPASWGLDRIDQAALPLDRSYTWAGGGAGVAVFVVDTGVRPTHQEFAGRIDAGRNTARDRAVGADASDCQGHGTHVAGTVAGAASGVARRARIVPVRVLGCDGSGTNADVIAGLDWVAKNARGPSVVNMSLGGGASRSLDAAVRDLTGRGIVVVAAAGNDDADACNASPARAPEAITVAASDRNDRRASFSNKGTCVDLFAPGHQIVSAWHTGDTATRTLSGTSMAAPHVAGAAALHLGARPQAKPDGVTRALLAATVEGKVSDPAGSPNRLLQVPGLGEAPPSGQPAREPAREPPKEEKKKEDKGFLCSLLGC